MEYNTLKETIDTMDTRTLWKNLSHCYRTKTLHEQKRPWRQSAEAPTYDYHEHGAIQRELHLLCGVLRSAFLARGGHFATTYNFYQELKRNHVAKFRDLQYGRDKEGNPRIVKSIYADYRTPYWMRNYF